MIRDFIITDKRRVDCGQVYKGRYLNDGTEDMELQTHRGLEITFDWEARLHKA